MMVAPFAPESKAPFAPGSKGARAMMSDRAARMAVVPYTELSAEDYADIHQREGVVEARAILAETENDGRGLVFQMVPGAGSLLPLRFLPTAGAAGLAEALSAFIAAEDPAAWLRGRQ